MSVMDSGLVTEPDVTDKPLVDPYCLCGQLQPCPDHCPAHRAGQQLSLLPSDDR